MLTGRVTTIEIRGPFTHGMSTQAQLRSYTHSSFSAGRHHKRKRLSPLDSFLHHFTRSGSVEDVKLRIRDRFPIHESTNSNVLASKSASPSSSRLMAYLGKHSQSVESRYFVHLDGIDD